MSTSKNYLYQSKWRACASWLPVHRLMLQVGQLSFPTPVGWPWHHLFVILCCVNAWPVGPVPILLQGTLCSALLKSLKPGPSDPQHVAAAVPLPDAWAGASEALELIYTWEDDEVVLSVIDFWSKVSGLLCGSWLQQQDDPTGTNCSTDHTPSQPSQHSEQQPSSAPPAAA